MSISDYYRLELICDAKGCGCHDGILRPSRMEAKDAARLQGWLLGKYGTAHCPEHANQRRESWRQPRKEA